MQVHVMFEAVRDKNAHKPNTLCGKWAGNVDVPSSSNSSSRSAQQWRWPCVSLGLRVPTMPLNIKKWEINSWYSAKIINVHTIPAARPGTHIQFSRGKKCTWQKPQVSTHGEPAQSFFAHKFYNIFHFAAVGCHHSASQQVDVCSMVEGALACFSYSPNGEKNDWKGTRQCRNF